MAIQLTLERYLAGEIRRRRDERNWSQADLAGEMTEMGISWTRAVVAALERSYASADADSRKLSVIELVALAALFDIALPEWFEQGPDIFLLEQGGSVKKDALIGILSGNRAGAFKGQIGQELPGKGDERSILLRLVGPTQLREFRAPGRWLRFLMDLGTADKLDTENQGEVERWANSFRENLGQKTPDLPDPHYARALSALQENAEGELEGRLAERLSIGRTVVGLLSVLKWGRSATEEADERLAVGQSKATIEEQLETELEWLLRSGPTALTSADSPIAAGRIVDPIVGSGALLNSALHSAVASPRMTVDRRADSGESPEIAPSRPEKVVPSRMYRPLYDFLKDAPGQSQSMSFVSIARLVGRPELPGSARAHRAWWANDSTHSHARSWLAAGWRVESVRMDSEEVTFTKVSGQ